MNLLNGQSISQETEQLLGAESLTADAGLTAEFVGLEGQAGKARHGLRHDAMIRAERLASVER